jgi:phosphoribosylformylglycinamidine synthase
MGEACKQFNTPVTGGNVSFYNQNPTGPVYPTPTIGMVGILDDINNKMSLDYKKAGDKIYLIGRPKNDIGSSEYLHKLHKVEYSNVPAFDLQEEYDLQQAVAALIKEKLVASAHDISEGGLMITLLEKGFNRNLGFDVTGTTGIRKDAFWFGEAQSRVVVSVPAEASGALEAALKAKSIDFSLLGTVTAADITVDGQNWGNIQEWKEKYDTAIEKIIAEN